MCSSQQLHVYDFHQIVIVHTVHTQRCGVAVQMCWSVGMYFITEWAINSTYCQCLN